PAARPGADPAAERPPAFGRAPLRTRRPRASGRRRGTGRGGGRALRRGRPVRLVLAPRAARAALPEEPDRPLPPGPPARLDGPAGRGGAPVPARAGPRAADEPRKAGRGVPGRACDKWD